MNIASELLVIFLLTVLNGIFAMSELAIVSSSRAKLQERADKGSQGAKTALQLSSDPNRFLATVQIGITLIGIFAGAVGGATLARSIAEPLRNIESLSPYADTIGFALVVMLTTYLSLVIGELVPKRLAINNPEPIAALVAPPMRQLSRLTSPIVSFLGFSVSVVMWLLGRSADTKDSVTESEIVAMIDEGRMAGVLHASEELMLKGVLRLDDLRVTSLMTPRVDVAWIECDATLSDIKEVVRDHRYALYPVCRGSLDELVGVVSVKEMVAPLIDGSFELTPLIHPPLYIPETATVGQFLERVRDQDLRLAFVIGEHGGVDGIISVQDVLDEIVGAEEPGEVVVRSDGSYLVDGAIPIHRLLELYPMLTLPEDEENEYQTLGGFIMYRLGHIPTTAERFEFGGVAFEIIDMDGIQIDKVLLSHMQSTHPKDAENA